METLINQLYQLDVWLFRLINYSSANVVFDWLMPFLTDFKRSWIIAALASGWIIFRRKNESILILGICCIAILFADQIASGFFKPLVERVRPCFELEHVRLLISQPKSFSFASSHAANTGAVATVVWIFFARSDFKDKIFSWIMMVYALLVGYSRAYVGVHYPSDVVGGFLIGVISGVSAYVAVSFLIKNYLNREESAT